MSTSSFPSYNFHLRNRHRSYGHDVSASCLSWTSILSVNQGLFSLNINQLRGGRGRGGQRRQTIKMDLNAVPPGAPLPSGSPFPGWSHWFLLTVIPMILPFFKSKWGPLLALKQRVDTTLETIDHLAEAVEDVAVKIDEVADEMVEKLPEGSKLKEAIRLVDKVAEGVIKSADLAEDLIDKVEVLEKKVEDLMEEEKMNKEEEVAPKSNSNQAAKL